MFFLIMNNITILYIVSSLKACGPTNQLYYIIKHLDKSIFSPIVLTLSNEPNESFYDRFESIGVRIISLGLSRISGGFFARAMIMKYISEVGVDIIHTQGFRADSLIASARVNVPWLLTSRNIPWHDYPMKYGKLQGALMARKHIKIMRHCRNVIACSKSVASLLSEKNIRAKPILNGVEVYGNKCKVSKELIDLSLPMFITVGSLIPRKNMSFLIETFCGISPDVRGSLIVLGDGPEMDFLKSKADSSVYFKGSVKNVEDYLALSDIFISTSLSEGLPNTVLEALGCGLPIVLSDIPSHREIAAECQGASLIFSLSDGREALERSILDAVNRFGEDSKLEALSVANSIFSAQVMSKAYQKTYLEILD